MAGFVGCRRRSGDQHPCDGDRGSAPDRNGPVPRRHRPSPHRPGRHPGLHRGLRRLGELQLRHRVGIVLRLRPGGRLRAGTVLACHRMGFDGLRRIGGDRTGQSRRLPARCGVHGDRSPVHLVGAADRPRFVLHGLQLLAKRSDRQPREEQPHRPSALRRSQFRFRVQSEPAERGRPRALRRGPHPLPGRDVQRRHGDELAAADATDHGRRGAPVRPGRRLPDQPAQCARRAELFVGIPLRTSRRAPRHAGIARAVPGLDVLPRRHRHVADAAATDDRAVSRSTAGDHSGPADAGSGRNWLRPHHQPRSAHPGAIPVHPEPAHRGGELPQGHPERVGQRDRLCDRRSHRSPVWHHTGRRVRGGRSPGVHRIGRPLWSANPAARAGHTGRRAEARHCGLRGARPDRVGHIPADGGAYGCADRNRNVASRTR